jgi:hypothetical protein
MLAFVILGLPADGLPVSAFGAALLGVDLLVLSFLDGQPAPTFLVSAFLPRAFFVSG